jgi:hypothetical protein
VAFSDTCLHLRTEQGCDGDSEYIFPAYVFNSQIICNAFPKATRYLAALKTRLSTPVSAKINVTNLKNPGLYYDGSAMIIINGVVVAQGSQFSLRDVEVVTGKCS